MNEIILDEGSIPILIDFLVRNQRLMKKIPTMFERDWEGNRSRVINTPHKDCYWVFNGEGIATRKLDGTCCLIKNNKLFKRHEVKKGKNVPNNFVEEDYDPETGKMVGWIPVGEGPEDKWHRFAFNSAYTDGTYELIGPHVQGNPEKVKEEMLISHHNYALVILEPPERTFEAIKKYLSENNIEGIVYHHPDGRMAKIKGRDFGIKRK